MLKKRYINFTLFTLKQAKHKKTLKVKIFPNSYQNGEPRVHTLHILEPLLLRPANPAQNHLGIRYSL
jgi:hypothetical protein